MPRQLSHCRWTFLVVITVPPISNECQEPLSRQKQMVKDADTKLEAAYRKISGLLGTAEMQEQGRDEEPAKKHLKKAVKDMKDALSSVKELKAASSSSVPKPDISVPDVPEQSSVHPHNVRGIGLSASLPSVHMSSPTSLSSVRTALASSIHTRTWPQVPNPYRPHGYALQHPTVAYPPSYSPYIPPPFYLLRPHSFLPLPYLPSQGQPTFQNEGCACHPQVREQQAMLQGFQYTPNVPVPFSHI
ncbi:hypothetical protein M422DRAFT_247219 [Sphaerobolus stellatus SS14]|nr:hypothetical protein M422DRAFT_247219 [Sphaerobolus stellatus SS14]